MRIFGSRHRSRVLAPIVLGACLVVPPGVLQSNELDYTLHNPVTITDVVIP